MWARSVQLPPTGDWWVWLNMSGRGAGKTRSGAEWIRSRRAGGARSIALVAETAADARDVMIDGESGIMRCCPPWDRPVYEPSKRRVTWIPTADCPWETVAIAFSGDKPDMLRGYQFDTVWLDEFAKYKRAAEVFPILDPAVRLGDDPRIYVSTTPVPSKAMRELVGDPDTHVVGESTFANRANLPAKMIARLERRYEGTRIGRQELYGELLEDVEGALWTHALIDRHRGRLMKAPGAPPRPPISPAGYCWMVFDFAKGIFRPVPDFVRVVVAVDPAVTAGPGSDDTGIVVAALGTDEHIYVLADKTCHLPPAGWGAQAVTSYHDFQADRIIGEVNNGGDLVEANIRVQDANVAYQPVRAARGKITRAEPVSTLYEAGLVHHLGSPIATAEGYGVRGFPELEDEQCTWVPGQPSPDRMDALVWGVTPLGVEEAPGPGIY